MVTLKDIASATGLSIGTVSGVLNSPAASKYAEATRKRVREAADRLGYMPNRMAQGLRMGNTRSIGMLVHSQENPYSAAIINTLSEAARGAGYSLLMEQMSQSGQVEEEDARLRELMGLRVSAIVAWITHHDAHAGLFKSLKERGIPLFVLGMPKKKFDADGVRITYESALESLAAHLAKLGHKRIGHLGSVPWSDQKAGRFKLFESKLETHGIRIDEADHCPAGQRLEEIRKAALDWLGERKKAGKLPTAVLCINDVAAMGTLRAISEMGLRAPEDISVVGIDGIEFGQFMPKKLATLAIDFEMLGQHVVETVMQRLEEPEPERFKVKTISAKFLEGETLGPAPE